MSPEELQVLKDMAAFIEWSIQHEKPFGWVLNNVAHDCYGILQKELCFLPRTTGYYEALNG